eukprot:CAMPEP_0119430582 /NCGR_PEP_ID=MMETSP1335-20130426/44355_1 /TAXON_ID=259385 /ORGANISM="Chrysoculter rhomboideus, Strain RCC1486" /LENGTH=221 /DNA_ID=CAMNT_0007456343 /DNA_START=20 /DNA_END=685 /DNA_ORIENTATION=+
MIRPLLTVLIVLLPCALSDSSMCTGIEKRFPRSGSVVCCPIGCGQCGGSKCASAPVPNPQSSCCPGPIVRKGEMCEAGSPGPCVLKKAGDPTCASNILAEDGKHCCPKSCGVCGGEDCASAPGGRKACCLPSRRKAGDERSCSKIDPPCIITPTASAGKRGALRSGVPGPLSAGGGAGGAGGAGDGAGTSSASSWGWLFIALFGVALIGLCGMTLYLAASA